jgi:hypothetical protein
MTKNLNDQNRIVFKLKISRFDIRILNLFRISNFDIRILPVGTFRSGTIYFDPPLPWQLLPVPVPRG